MKKIVFIMAIVVSCITLVSFSNLTPPPNEGKIGDVKYSILEPAKFIVLHGDGWILMDGRNINNSELFRLTTMNTCPDARGVFIRGMNQSRNITEGDIDGDRKAGAYQADGVKKHQHGFSDAWFAEVNCGHGNELGSHSSDSDNMRCESGDVTDNGIGLLDETRPRNIALYTYVKINN